MTLSRHNQKVEKIRDLIKSIKEPFALKSGQASNTLRNGTYKKKEIDLSSLSEVVHIDKDEMIAFVEPCVTMEKLVNQTLKHGLIPLVTPEFKTITVGGAIMGAAIESSSHLHGQFNDACTELELILGNGEKIMASPQENEDLFYGISGSYGTLATLTLAKIKLKKAPAKVVLNYHFFETSEEICSFFHHSKSPFLEGFMLEKNQFVAVEGNFEGECVEKHFSQKFYWDQWFIDHVREKPKCEWMEIKDYLFRLDRGGFWMGKALQHPSDLLKSLFKYKVGGVAENVKKRGATSKPNHFLFRLFFGGAFSSESLYKIWHQVPPEILKNLFFIHDFYAPFEKANDILKQFQDVTGILPVWLCLVKGTTTPQFLSPHFGKEKFLNIGLYGIPKHSTIELAGQLEKEIISCGGRKMLYSYCYYSKDDFEKIYNEAKYNELREKYHANEKFPSLYEKVTSI